MQTFARNELLYPKTEQFELWYQPVYNLPEGNVIHNEVLLRWRTLNGQLKSPKDFMPSIFQSGLESWLDRLVIKNSVETLEHKPGSTLSINLSRQVSDDTQIASFINSLISEFYIHPSRIHLEISEKNIAGNFEEYVALVRDLRQIGCTLILDNFANDYLTFVQWEKLNVNFVKIRGNLIHQSYHDSYSEGLLQSILDVGSSLGQLTVAKSIEAIDTSLFLERLRCDSAQGYHLKPPSPELCLSGKVEILGVPIDNVSMDELLQNLDEGIVFTPNVDHLMNVRKYKEFSRAYSTADYKLCDSQILYFASRFLGHPIKEKISGSDLFPAFYHYHKNNPDISIFLLGGMANIALQAQQNINQKVDRAIVVDTYSPPHGFDEDEEASLKIVDQINQSGATVLAIGLGAPKQEQWIYHYRQRLTTIKIIFAIGATIDFEAGVVSRAPQAISSMGAEWLYRLTMEPQRLWKRYLINDIPFIWLLLKQKMLG